MPTLFSYPFGEYSKLMRDYISQNFKIAFGQHSGIIDVNKNKFELPRFPINEKYGDINRFKSIINYYPLEYEILEPEEKKLTKENNPPKFKVKFFKNQKNISNINCYSNEGDQWMKSNIKLVDNELIYNTLKTIQVVKTIQSKNGPLGANRYIISNNQTALNVMQLYTMLKLVAFNDKLTIDIVPLFETVTDLENAPKVMGQLYTTRKPRLFIIVLLFNRM